MQTNAMLKSVLLNILAEVRAGAAVAVIDQNTKKQLFPSGENPLGEVILFKGKPLQIIGVAAEQNAASAPRKI